MTAAKSSTINYSGLILKSQFLHLALSNKNEIIGILSYQLITFLQPGQ